MIEILKDEKNKRIFWKLTVCTVFLEPPLLATAWLLLLLPGIFFGIVFCEKTGSSKLSSVRKFVQLINLRCRIMNIKLLLTHLLVFSMCIQ